MSKKYYFRLIKVKMHLPNRSFHGLVEFSRLELLVCFCGVNAMLRHLYSASDLFAPLDITGNGLLGTLMHVDLDMASAQR